MGCAHINIETIKRSLKNVLERLDPSRISAVMFFCYAGVVVVVRHRVLSVLAIVRTGDDHTEAFRAR